MFECTFYSTQALIGALYKVRLSIVLREISLTAFSVRQGQDGVGTRAPLLAGRVWWRDGQRGRDSHLVVTHRRRHRGGAPAH